MELYKKHNKKETHILEIDIHNFSFDTANARFCFLFIFGVAVHFHMNISTCFLMSYCRGHIYFASQMIDGIVA